MAIDNKTVRESFRATESEDKDLINAALHMNMKKSEYIRYKLFEENISSVPCFVDISNNDIYIKLKALREKYIIAKYNIKDITRGHMINLEIKNIDKIIENLKNLDEGKEIIL